MSRYRYGWMKTRDGIARLDWQTGVRTLHAIPDSPAARRSLSSSPALLTAPKATALSCASSTAPGRTAPICWCLTPWRWQSRRWRPSSFPSTSPWLFTAASRPEPCAGRRQASDSMMTDDERYEEYLIQEALGEAYPQAGRTRMVMPHPIASSARRPNPENALLGRCRRGRLHDGRQSRLAPHAGKAPTLLDFFHLRFSRHHVSSPAPERENRARCRARREGRGGVPAARHLERRTAAHGSWLLGRPIVAPYVSARRSPGPCKHHQALRYFADEAAGFNYPDAYNSFFGPDYEPPEYIRQAHEDARNHRWYMTSRLITIYDIYASRTTGTSIPRCSPTSSAATSSSRGRPRVRRLARRPHVADHDLAEQLPLTPKQDIAPKHRNPCQARRLLRGNQRRQTRPTSRSSATSFRSFPLLRHDDHLRQSRLDRTADVQGFSRRLPLRARPSGIHRPRHGRRLCASDAPPRPGQPPLLRRRRPCPWQSLHRLPQPDARSSSPPASRPAPSCRSSLSCSPSRPTDFPKPFVKWACEPARAEDVPAAIARACYIAMQPPRGPTFVSIPIDDWERRCPPVAPTPGQRLIRGDPRHARRRAAKRSTRRRAARHHRRRRRRARRRMGRGRSSLPKSTRRRSGSRPSPRATASRKTTALFAGFLAAGARSHRRRPDRLRLHPRPRRARSSPTMSKASVPQSRKARRSSSSSTIPPTPPGPLSEPRSSPASAPASPICSPAPAAPARRAQAARPPAPPVGREAHRRLSLPADRSPAPAGTPSSSRKRPSTRGALHDYLPILDADTFYTCASGGLGHGLPRPSASPWRGPRTKSSPSSATARPCTRSRACGAPPSSASPSPSLSSRTAATRPLIEFGRRFGLNRTPGADLPGLDFCALARGQGVRGRATSIPPPISMRPCSSLQRMKGPSLVEVSVE